VFSIASLDLVLMCNIDNVLEIRPGYLVAAAVTAMAAVTAVVVAAAIAAVTAVAPPAIVLIFAAPTTVAAPATVFAIAAMPAMAAPTAVIIVIDFRHIAVVGRQPDDRRRGASGDRARGAANGQRSHAKHSGERQLHYTANAASSEFAHRVCPFSRNFDRVWKLDCQ
jgi:hypothetical protein